jgi:hypothetical protein
MTGLGPSSLALLKPAFSEGTREIVQHVQTLQSPASPASLHPQRDERPDKRPLQERLFDALREVKILTSQVAMHMDKEWRDKLFYQLDALHDPAEWEGDDQPIRKSSFETFLKAMLSISPERRPGLGLSHAGHLIAAWTTDEDRLTIEFLPNDRVRWVLSRHSNGEIERYAGDTGVSSLAAGLSKYHTERWFSRAQEI